jgi:predicted TIM-barrel fold metal-dependent hydrolase
MTRRRFGAGLAAMLPAGVLADSTRITKMNFAIIDPHVHVWKHDPKYPFAPGAHVPAEDRTPEMLLELMKANNVERTVIIQVIHYKWDNTYLADVLKQYPKTFKGVARVNPEDPGAPDHLSELMRKPGFHGVRISPGADERSNWITGPLMPPLWKRCEELKVPMTVLCPATRLPDIEKLIDKFPALTVVIDHMADCPLDQPAQLAHLLALEKFPNVFIKISHTWSLSKEEFPYKDSQALVKHLYDKFGPKRLMWGTDWPICLAKCSYAQTLGMVRDQMSFLNEDDKHWILNKTVQRVWNFGL